MMLVGDALPPVPVLSQAIPGCSERLSEEEIQALLDALTSTAGVQAAAAAAGDS